MTVSRQSSNKPAAAKREPARRPAKAEKRDAASKGGTSTRLEPDLAAFLIAATDIQRLIGRDIRKLSRKSELSERGLTILHMVNAGINRPALLAKYFDVLPSTITADTEKLVTANLLRRREVAGDRRAIQFELSDKGHAVRRQAVKALNSQFGERIGKVTSKDLETCIYVLTEIGSSLDLKTPTVKNTRGSGQS